MMKELKDENIENIEVTNKLLLELIKSQKQNTSNMIKMFIVTVVSLSIIILGTVIGFLVYESQFETVASDYEYEVEQDAESNGSGDAVNNFGGDMYYGSGETNGTN